MKAPIESLSKEEIVAIHRFRCCHGHTGLVHYNCYREANGQPERIGFLDIETSNLDADFGIMFSWCILDEQNTNYYDVVSKHDLQTGLLDKEVVTSCLKNIKRFDRIVGHYSSRFDIPFVRSRALYWGLDDLIPQYGDLKQTDTWRMAKDLLKISSNRQGNIAELLQGETAKTRITSKYWIAALQGEKAALEYILEHNRIDVIELRNNYNRLRAFAPRSGRSF